MFDDTSSLAYLVTNKSVSGYTEILGDLKNVDLSLVEKLWASWYIWINNDIFATGLLFFLTHEIMYFGRCIPWYIIDRMPYFRKWKIQPTKIPSDKEQWECIKAVFKSHLMVEVIPIWLFHPLCAKLNISVQVPFPSWKAMMGQMALFFFLEDLWHYSFHRLFHVGIFYKYIHKQHHRYAAPFGFAAEYAHPIEVMALGLGTVGFPILYAYLTKYHFTNLPILHLFTITVWITLRLFQAVDSHSGYDFPWSLNKVVPFWAGAEHHDDHHHFFIGNYASSFRWFDYFLKTECGELAKAKREQRMKKVAEYRYKKHI